MYLSHKLYKHTICTIWKLGFLTPPLITLTPAKAIDVVSRCISPSPLDVRLRVAYNAYLEARIPRAPGARFYATPWLAHASPGPEALLLDPELVALGRARDFNTLFDIFTRDAPPPAFFLPLTSATAGLRWGTLTLTLTRDPLDSASTPEVRVRDNRRDQRRILLVLRRPPSLGSRLRFVNPEHAHPEPGAPVPPPPPHPRRPPRLRRASTDVPHTHTHPTHTLTARSPRTRARPARR